MTAARDVAAKLQELIPGHIGAVKMNKLLYFVQGYHLAWFDRAAFHGRIAAFEMGPVAADYWADEKHGRLTPDPVAIDDDTDLMEVVHMVVQMHGNRSGVQLIDITHEDGPWQAVWDDPKTDIITHEQLVEHFRDDPLTKEQRVELGLNAKPSWTTFEPDPPGALDELERSLLS